MSGIARAVLTIILSCGVAASACSPAGRDPLVLRLGHVGTPGSLYDRGALKFKELVEARLPGRVEIRVFPSSQLGEDREMLQGLRLGILEVHVPSSVLNSVEPLLTALDLPFLIKDRAHFERIISGPFGGRIKQRLLEQDLVLLAFWENGFRMITNNIRPVVTPADLRGIKIRTPKDPERVKLFHAFGANAMSMPFGELFTALRQGAIDGQENPLAQIVSARLYEVQKYLSVSRHVYSPGYPIMSRAFFESLPEDVARVVREAAVEAGAYQRMLGEREDEEFLTLCAQHVQVSEIDRGAFEAAARPIYEEFARRVGSDVIEALRREESNAAGQGRDATIATRHVR